MGCDPEINIVSLGAKILESLKDESKTIDEILLTFPSELKVSMDHIILSLDWLYIIGSIRTDGEETLINAATK